MNDNVKITKKDFLTNRDETGREIVTFLETGKQYYVEYIKPRGHKTTWGDVDPATKKLTGTYGAKHNGAITAEESLITKENGFDNISEGSGDAYWKIQKMHDEWKANNGY